MSAKFPYRGRILMIGYGSVGRCTMPLIERHFDMPMNRITIVDAVDASADAQRFIEVGLTYVVNPLVESNLAKTLAKYVPRILESVLNTTRCWHSPNRGATTAFHPLQTFAALFSCPTAHLSCHRRIGSLMSCAVKQANAATTVNIGEDSPAFRRGINRLGAAESARPNRHSRESGNPAFFNACERETAQAPAGSALSRG